MLRVIPSAPKRLGRRTFHPSISSWSYRYLGYAALIKIMVASIEVLFVAWFIGCSQFVPSVSRLVAVLVDPMNHSVPS